MKVVIALISLISTAHAAGSGAGHGSVTDLMWPAHAAGSGAGHGSVTDLMWPAINFALLASFLVWKVKTPLREMFEKNANDVKFLFEHAEKKDKEANIKLNALQEKMSNLSSEKNKITQNAEKEANDFISKSEKESEEYLRRLEADSINKIEHEKVSRVAALEENLIDEVIAKAKTKIGKDSGLSEKVTKKLISQIR